MFITYSIYSVSYREVLMQVVCSNNSQTIDVLIRSLKTISFYNLSVWNFLMEPFCMVSVWNLNFLYGIISSWILQPII